MQASQNQTAAFWPIQSQMELHQNSHTQGRSGAWHTRLQRSKGAKGKEQKQSGKHVHVHMHTHVDMCTHAMCVSTHGQNPVPGDPSC